MEEIMDTCTVQKQSFWSRIARRFGYGDCLQPDFENDPYNVGYAESCLQTIVLVHLGCFDRLRILLSGRIVVRTSTKTEPMVERSYSKSNTSVAPVGYKP